MCAYEHACVRVDGSVSVCVSVFGGGGMVVLRVRESELCVSV